MMRQLDVMAPMYESKRGPRPSQAFSLLQILTPIKNTRFGNYLQNYYNTDLVIVTEVRVYDQTSDYDYMVVPIPSRHTSLRACHWDLIPETLTETRKFSLASLLPPGTIVKSTLGRARGMIFRHSDGKVQLSDGRVIPDHLVVILE